MENQATLNYDGALRREITPIASGQLSIKSNVQLIVEIES